MLCGRADRVHRLPLLEGKQAALPEGIVSGNGRLEAKLVDVSAKEPLRVKEILVNEGDVVKPGQVLAQLDTSTLESQLAEAKAAVAAAQERLALAKASIVKQQTRSSSPNPGQALAEPGDRARRLAAGARRAQHEGGDDQSHARAGRGGLKTAQARGRRAQGRRDGADPDRRRHAQVTRERPRALSPGRSRARCSPPAARR